MRFFAQLSIRWKLVLVSMLASAAVSALACGIFFAHAQMRARTNIEQALETRADILGSVSAAAVLFQDHSGAIGILEAMRADPRVVRAMIYDRERQLFAQYVRDGDEADPPHALADPKRTRDVHGERFEVVRPVDFKGGRIGYVALESDLADLRAITHDSIVLASIVLGFCIVIGWLLANLLQRVVSRPVLTLAASAQAISRDGDYAVRVPENRDDELGTLARSFNAMLEQIEHRDAELAASRDALEERVAERTRELELEIAERRQAQVALTEQTERLSRSNADLEQFAYVASHDLQEPLRMVASYTQLLAKGEQDRLRPEAKEYIAFAIDGATRMQSLISDLLRYSRLASEPTPLVPLEPEDLLATVRKNLEVAISENGAVVTADPLPVVRGNESQLVQLLQNLVANAIKFRGEQPPVVHVSAVSRGDFIEFAVRDNGVGFDPKYAPKIFVIFQRLHARGKYPGTGIGLAVCKKIVERHGGTIWVESAPGAGTTFFFTLPRGDAAAVMREEEVRDAV